MGRLILTNKHDCLEKLNHTFGDLLGLKQSGIFDSENTFISVFHKKCICNENYFRLSDEECIFSNGTIIYDGNMGSSGLEHLINDIIYWSEKEDIATAIKYSRKKAIGMYVIVVVLKEQIICFVDETAIYNFYYYMKDKDILCTNTYYNVNECIETPIIYDNFIENSFCSTIVGKIGRAHV